MFLFFPSPRFLQLSIQWVLVTLGMGVLGFSLLPLQALLALISAVGTQWLWMQLLNKPRDYWSALITASGTALILRADNLWLHPLVVALAISAKFLFQMNQRPVFNPANLAIVTGSLMVGGWVSPAQWGRESWVLLLIVSVGTINVIYARQWASTLGFLGGIVFLLTLRFLYLGEDIAIFRHHVFNANLLIFAFLMMSDPRTTPASHPHKALYGAWIGACHVAYQYVYWRPNGMLYALFISSLLWWSMDRVWKMRNNSILRSVPH